MPTAMSWAADHGPRARPQARGQLPGDRLRRHRPGHQAPTLTAPAGPHPQGGRAGPPPPAQPGRRAAHPNTSATVGYLLDRWLELAPLALTTRDTSQAYLRRHVHPALGTLPLRKLTVDGLDRFYLRLARHGGRCPPCTDRADKGVAPPGARERYAA